MGLYPMGRDHRVVEIGMICGFCSRSVWFVGFDQHGSQVLIRGEDWRGSWVLIEQSRSGGSWVLIEQWIQHGWILDSDWLGWVGVVMLWWW